MRYAILLPLLVLMSPTCEEQIDGGTVSSRIGTMRFHVTEGPAVSGAVGDPVIGVTLQTDSIYPCANYSVLTEVDKRGKKFTVRVTGIFKPEVCATTLGPATGFLPLSLSKGTYELEFVSGSSSVVYAMTVTESSISVSGRDPGFVVPDVSLAWRYPRPSFAFLCGSLSSNGWVCSDFLDTLVHSGLFTEVVLPDSGWSPYPRSASGYALNTPARIFRYATEAHFDTAGAMLTRYVLGRTSGQEGIGLQLINWRSQQYRSWMLTGG